jgi:type IV pilus assembly protein PilA
MNSIKCLSCGFVSWADQETCKKCKASLTALPEGSNSEQPPYPNHPPVSETFMQQRVKKHLAIHSAILGAINLCTLGLFGVGAVVGVILSVVTLNKIKQRPDRYSGQGLATAGLVMSILSIVMAVPIGIIAAIAIPNLLASRRAANEGSAMYVLRRIGSAEAIYQDQRQTFGTLEQLAADRLIDPATASGTLNGYKFKINISNSANGDAEFEAIAVPADYPSSGRRSFLIDETGVMRAADSHGGDASRSDPPLQERRAYRSDDD